MRKKETPRNQLEVSLSPLISCGSSDRTQRETPDSSGYGSCWPSRHLRALVRLIHSESRHSGGELTASRLAGPKERLFFILHALEPA